MIRKIRFIGIRKLQWGCNPNSSSIGMMVFAVPPLLFMLFVVYAVAGFAVISRFLHKEPDDGE